MKVIVHGGAGGAPDDPEPRQAVLDDAAAAGADADDPVDAVEAAVRVLESDERFNAGVGGAVQSDGIIRTDAGVMDSQREAGAAAGMPGVEHAVSVARGVLEETPHVFLSGVHAVDFAEDIEIDTEVDLWTERSREQWDDLDSHPEGTPLEHVAWLDDKFGGSPDNADSDDTSGRGDEHDHDTVGAVAFDGDRFATATSTGGRWLALAGRVGDVPQIGSGFYAAPAGAASATGAGEDIAKATLTRRAVRHLESGLDAQAAADRAIDEFAELTGSSAGVIVLDTDGNAGESYNSDAMQTSTR
ncbi:isoaspartyl peptidase/L-asparaginase [Salarchaeum sp. JOR-1]|uniref:isoaspartyl peptidase/L-asparaginase n=1 Tax=Salarchaeum sp. JOR-1 TaxID=2599399 RepID=UPI001198765F|nr:isoaspartyl peptidase/L-asparaginase [Salarchaeum sp. JOR-1]QDX40728.1 asparaginase [Salarchaeum sp. JOR-1]